MGLLYCPMGLSTVLLDKHSMYTTKLPLFRQESNSFCLVKINGQWIYQNKLTLHSLLLELLDNVFYVVNTNE